MLRPAAEASIPWASAAMPLEGHTATGSSKYALPQTMGSILTAVMFCTLSFWLGIPSTIAGPLKVSTANPRYFMDGNGRVIYLTGSHTWRNFQERATLGHPIESFDYVAYLDFLESNKHNFVRLWVWEGGLNKMYTEPLAYVRTGPGVALDGKPKFDLTRFDQKYFNRLRYRVQAARDRGIYVAIMLFQGWSLYSHGYGNPWPLHPCNGANNINGIDGDSNGDGSGQEMHSLRSPIITDLQKAYVRKVIDTVNDLDNVLYEITNESDPTSKNWQYQIIDYIKAYESSKPKQHPVGISCFDGSPSGTNASLKASNADWVSLCNDGSGDYDYDVPAADGEKVSIADTDHLLVNGNTAEIPVWIWRNFTRGHNPILMDPFNEPDDSPDWDLSRKILGQTLAYANRMDLAAMTPQGHLSSTAYALAKPGFEYLVYQPGSGSFTVNLACGNYKFEWLNPASGSVIAEKSISGGATRSFTPPISGPAVLYLKSAAVTPAPPSSNCVDETWENITAEESHLWRQ